MERNGRLMAQAKTTALTKKIDDMLDSWEQYARDVKVVCYQCALDNHHNCREILHPDTCDCACNDEEWVRVSR